MAIPLVVWGIGLAILAFGGGGTTPPQQRPAPGADPVVARIQTALLALGFSDGTMRVTGIWDLPTGWALEAYWAKSGGFVPLTRPQLAARLEALLAGEAAPSLTPAAPANTLRRIEVALAKLGFSDLNAYFLSKGEFPTDNTATGWAVLLSRLEAEAGISQNKVTTGNLRA